MYTHIVYIYMSICTQSIHLYSMYIYSIVCVYIYTLHTYCVYIYIHYIYTLYIYTLYIYIYTIYIFINTIYIYIHYIYIYTIYIQYAHICTYIYICNESQCVRISKNVLCFQNASCFLAILLCSRLLQALSLYLLVNKWPVYLLNLHGIPNQNPQAWTNWSMLLLHYHPLAA